MLNLEGALSTAQHWKWGNLEVLVVVVEISLKYECPDPGRSPVRDNLTIPFQDVSSPKTVLKKINYIVFPQ